ncbi:hypothetical protein OBBRIDRAFT_805697 [Obba rivulosa]|uniref:Secreted protein n=1 Tax=Obba rivulosa TaxID=1052685 RepID=A0A8E2DHA4_9APHY|nr:hypothetical protein OBBRIDRAFT_805697 [Obba rivulosa]
MLPPLIAIFALAILGPQNHLNLGVHGYGRVQSIQLNLYIPADALSAKPQYVVNHSRRHCNSEWFVLFEQIGNYRDSPYEISSNCFRIGPTSAFCKLRCDHLGHAPPLHRWSAINIRRRSSWAPSINNAHRFR